MTTRVLIAYNKKKSEQKHRMFTSIFKRDSLKSFTKRLGACTGFDGGLEVGAAIRRLLDCVSTGKLNINADEQYALAA